MAEANAGESPASASSTSSSDELKSSSSEDSVSAPGLVLFHEEKHSSSDEGFDRFADLCNGQRDRGSTVHFWTIPHSDGAGRLTAENTSRKAMMRHFRAVYGDNVSYWAIFRELHAASGTAWERKPHYHIVLRLTGRVRGIRIAQELRQRCIYAHLSVPTRYADFWRAFAYCWVPSVRKPMSELDQEPLTSKNFPMEEAQKKLRARLARSQVVRPWDLFQVVSKNPSIQEYADLVLWAQEQQRRGVTQYMAYMVKQGSKMPGLFKSWKQLVARPSSQRTLREERLRIWSEARQKPCTCTTPNRLKLGLAALLEHHNKDGARLAYFIQRLVRIGTAAKNSNIIIFGASNAGKTCLTRPLISLFRHRAWLRPNKGDTFPLEGLQDYLVACWQDWRLGTTPIAWDTLLLLLEGETVLAACKGAASVVVETPPPFIVTCQERVVPLNSKHQVDHAEKEAFENRFCLRWHLRTPLPANLRDMQMKQCYGCVRCYTDWVEEGAAEYKRRAPEIEKETTELEASMQAQPAQAAAPVEVREAAQPAEPALELSSAAHPPPVPAVPAGSPARPALRAGSLAQAPPALAAGADGPAVPAIAAGLAEDSPPAKRQCGSRRPETPPTPWWWHSNSPQASWWWHSNSPPALSWWANSPPASWSWRSHSPPTSWWWNSR